MKKFTLSLATTAAVALAAGCGADDDGNNNDVNGNNQNAEVNEEPDVNLADNNNENNDGDNDLNTDNNTGLNDNNGLGEEEEEEVEALMDQDFENFDLNVTLVDDTTWEFSYSPATEEDEEPDAHVSGGDIDLEGESAVEEMEAYLSDFHVNAASETDEILTEAADTFDFSEGDIQEYDLTINFVEHEDDTQWNWSQDEQDNGDTENDMNDDAEQNDDMNNDD